MVMIGKARGLNRGETYPCSVRMLKERFVHTNVHIGIGLTRDYAFDSLARNRPAIHGRIIASLQVNHREGRENDGGILGIYPISSATYTAREIAEFESVWLEELYRWYVIQQNDPVMTNSVNCLVIEFDHGSFRTHTYSFQ